MDGSRIVSVRLHAITSPRAPSPSSREGLPLPHRRSGAEMSVAAGVARGRDHFDALAGGVLRRSSYCTNVSDFSVRSPLSEAAAGIKVKRVCYRKRRHKRGRRWYLPPVRGDVWALTETGCCLPWARWRPWARLRSPPSAAPWDSSSSLCSGSICRSSTGSCEPSQGHRPALRRRAD
jgi:hypothetical protein